MMFLREMFGFPPPGVSIAIGYDSDADVVFLKVGRTAVVLTQREASGLIEDLMDSMDEQNRNTRSNNSIAPGTEVA
ncbi:hypothetical protein ACLMAL_39510 [Nocardia sp. CWNU-33]|uniref:hypothetical protein n=1 Tax=Nocardia sp. CWNU-33 TaxID=3392117 RepID=UPI00398F04AC